MIEHGSEIVVRSFAEREEAEAGNTQLPEQERVLLHGMMKVKSEDLELDLKWEVEQAEGLKMN